MAAQFTQGIRIVNARRKKPFRSLEDLCQRAALTGIEREQLVNADALRELSGHRYQSHWQNLGIEEARPLFDADSHEEESLPLPTPSDIDTLLAGDRHLGLTLATHPLALVRHLPGFDECLSARQLRHGRHGQLARVGGLCINEQ